MRERGRFSIFDMMAVVSIVAAECWLLRTVTDTGRLGLALFVLPMLNLICLGLVRSKRRPAARPFWVAFEVVGCAAMGVMFFLEWGYRQYDWGFFYAPITWLYKQGWLSEDKPVEMALGCLCVSAIYTFPQFMPALVAGWISGRYRIVRRDTPEVGWRGSALAGRSAPIETDPAAEKGTLRALGTQT